jgi:hypothetical protein
VNKSLFSSIVYVFIPFESICKHKRSNIGLLVIVGEQDGVTTDILKSKDMLRKGMFSTKKDYFILYTTCIIDEKTRFSQLLCLDVPVYVVLQRIQVFP